LNYRPVYLDTSALAKLIIPEAESRALAAWLVDWPDQFTSAVTQVEMMRLLKRGRATPGMFSRAEAVLDSVVTLHVDRPVLASAAPDKATFAAFLDDAKKRYRRVLFLGGGGTDLLSSRWTVEPILSERFQIPEYDSPWNAYPRFVRRKEFDYSVYAFAAPDDNGDLFAWAEGCGPIERNGQPLSMAWGLAGSRAAPS
jgi:uncharacterized protein with PIN domain